MNEVQYSHATLRHRYGADDRGPGIVGLLGQYLMDVYFVCDCYGLLVCLRTATHCGPLTPIKILPIHPVWVCDGRRPTNGKGRGGIREENVSRECLQRLC